MAQRKIWLGSIGPYLYDDSNSFSDGTGHGLKTDRAPTDPEDVLRQADVGGGGIAAPSDAQYVVIALDGDLSDERRLQVSSELGLTDGGANGDVTIDADDFAYNLGRSGGQTLIGGTAAADDLLLYGTSHGTPSGAGVVIAVSPSTVLGDPIISLSESLIELDSRGVAPISLLGGVVVNDDGDDVDFRVEGSTKGNLIFADAGNDRVGVSQGAPGSTLEVGDNSTMTDGTGGVRISQSGAGDSMLQFLLVGTENYSIGIDNNDSDKFKIGNGLDLNSSTLMTFTSGGLVGIGNDAPAHLLDLDGTSPILNISRAAADRGEVRFSTSGTRRWSVGIGSQAESGSNAGSDFEIKRATDAGALQEVTMQIHRDTGVTQFRKVVQFDDPIRMIADEITDTTPNDDTTLKKVTLQKLASPPTNAAYVAFSNNPGTDTFYLVLEEA